MSEQIRILKPRKALKTQIDQMVYQLYDLTAEEIEIIENSVK